MKRIDKIKSMTTEELVEMLINIDLCEVCEEYKSTERVNGCKNCRYLAEEEAYIKWLEMEI